MPGLRAFHRVAIATACLTFVQILMGGLVHATGSSLACPDWPLCYGSAFPQMVGGVLFEHSHRLVGTAVGLLSIALVMLGWRAGGRPKKLAALILTAVITQGVLGGLTVIFKLPTLVSTAHLALSMAFLMLVVYTALVTRATERTQVTLAPALRTLLVLTGAATYLQIILGALVRHTQSGTACFTDFPSCRGTFWPTWHPTAQLHMLHRFVALGVAALVLALTVPLYRAVRGHRTARGLAAALPVLVAVQILLGYLSVKSLLGVWQVTAHLGVAALILGSLFGLALVTRGAVRARVAAGAPRARAFRDVIALTKPRISILSVATAAAGLALAPGTPDGRLTIALLLGTLLLVGAANTLNMWWERDVDGLMARTRNRPLPAGRLRADTALSFGLAQAILAIPMLWMGANALTGVLGAIALVLYVLVYTPLKRRTTLSLLIGAIPGAMPPLLGWTAASGRIDVAGLALFAVIFFWQVPHFIAIAMFRKGDYVAAGMKVLPAERGDAHSKKVIVHYLLAQVAVTLLLVPLGLGGWLYMAGAVGLGAWMLALAIRGVARETDARWARGLFLASVAYLPLLFGLLVAS